MMNVVIHPPPQQLQSVSADGPLLPQSTQENIDPDEDEEAGENATSVAAASVSQIMPKHDNTLESSLLHLSTAAKGGALPTSSSSSRGGPPPQTSTKQIESMQVGRMRRKSGNQLQAVSQSVH